MPGSAQEIRYINRDENTHLSAVSKYDFAVKRGRTGAFTKENIQALKEMLNVEGVSRLRGGTMFWETFNIPGISKEMITEYIKYLGNLRFTGLGFDVVYPGYKKSRRV